MSTCPDIVELEQYVLRELDDGTITSIGQHLSGCAECSSQIKDLEENLKVALALRRDGAATIAITAPRPAGMDEPELTQVGPYKILRKLGQGGMGAVYEAQQENPRRIVALKMIRPGLVSRALLQRFRHESQILGRLKHPGIAQIYEAGTHQPATGGPPQPYFVMEAVHGPPLLEYAKQNQLDVRQRLELLAKICDTVQHAHQRGVIHRDLKPDNILIDTSTTDVGSTSAGLTTVLMTTAAEASAAAQPKILDFGVARVIDPDSQHTTLHTSAGQIIGTVAYMSPEQAGGDPADIDTRSDVYALGVIAYQLLCGKLPHKVSPHSVAESIRTIVQDEPMPLSNVNRAFRGDVTTIVGKALSKEKSRRYQSAAEMAADIRRFLRDEPITAHPPSTMYQLGKFARRNKGLVAGVAAAFVVLILGVIGTSIGLVRAARSASDARLEADKQTAINEFLVQLLGSANPRRVEGKEVKKGREITVVEALDQAGAKLDKGSLKDQPIVELAVRLTMGNTYIELSEYDPAERHILRALDLANQTVGPVSKDAADCTNSLAFLRRCQGKQAEAESLSRKALEMTKLVYGPEHRNAAVAMNVLALILQDQGKHAEAEPLLRGTLELRERTLGPEHEDVTTSMNNLALLLENRGENDEAEALMRKTLAIREKQLGDEHPNIAVVLNNLGFVLREQGKFDEAEQCFRRSLAMRRKLLGEEHADTASAINNLGSLLQAAGKLEEAEPLYREAIELQRRIHGDGHPAVAGSINNLATLLREQKKYAEAEVIFRQALEIRRKALGEDHPAVAVGMSNLSSVLRELDKFEEAEQLSRRAVAISTARFGANALDTTAHRVHLGVCLIGMKRYEEAEQELLAAEKVFAPRFQSGDKRAVSAVGNLKRLYTEWGKPDRAAEYEAKLATTRPATQPAAQR